MAEHFSGKPPSLRRTFNRFAAIVKESGPVTVYAQQTRIVIQARVRFAGAVVREDWVDAGVWLKRRATHPRLIRTESFRPAGYGLHFRLDKPEDVDEALAEFIREAYLIGIEELSLTPPGA